MDFRVAVEPGPCGVTGTSCGETAAMQQPTTGRSRGGGRTSGAGQGVLLRGEVFGFLCRRDTTSFDYQREQGVAS
jgi:hypothetical protein